MLALARRSSRALGARATLAPAPRRGVGSMSIPGTPRRLDEITKVDLLQAEEPSRVGAIWESYHAEMPSVAGASVDPEEHASMLARGAESPTFVFPVRGDGGHYMLLSQYTAANSMFALTFLEDYKRSPATAQPWASVQLFDELLDTKAVGLVRAEVMPERLASAEADRLLMLVRRYYGTSAYDKVRTRRACPPPSHRLRARPEPRPVPSPDHPPIPSPLFDHRCGPSTTPSDTSTSTPTSRLARELKPAVWPRRCASARGGRATARHGPRGPPARRGEARGPFDLPRLQ